MKKLTLLILAFFIFGATGLQTATAQFPGKLKIPKPSKPKAEEPASDEPAPSKNTQPAKPQPESQSAPNQTATAGGDDQPTIAKDSIQIRAYTNPEYHGKYDTWSWVPAVEYRVNGPIASGSQLYVEFSTAGGSWIKFDCKTGEAQKGHWWKTECGGNDLPRDKGMTYTGPVTFTIRLRNELAGNDLALFTGRMKVARVPSNESGPTAVNHFVYYVDHDWNLPIGYVFYEADDVRGWNFPTLNFAFWARGEVSNPFEPICSMPARK
jgi:hypothetical protein